MLFIGFSGEISLDMKPNMSAGNLDLWGGSTLYAVKADDYCGLLS